MSRIQNPEKRIAVIPAVVSAVVSLATFTALFIFTFQNGDDSSRLSGVFVNIIVGAFETFGYAPNIAAVTFAVRKLAHFTLFFIFGLSVFSEFYFLRVKKFAVAVVIAFGFLTAAANEACQLIAIGRNASGWDVLLDFAGSLIGCAVFALIAWIVRGVKRNSIGEVHAEEG